MQSGNINIQGDLEITDELSATALQKLIDNMVLNAFRIAINGSLVKFNMIDGIMDEFEDESGVDTGTSANEDYDSSNDLYSPVGELIDRTAGTIIGDMTTAGQQGNAFDGNIDQAAAACAWKTTDVKDAYIGKDWGESVSKVIVGFKAYGSNDVGFHFNVASDVTIKLYGSNTAPTTWDDGTLLATATTVPDAASLLIEKYGAITTTAYRYHWIHIHSDILPDGTFCAECQFFTINNMTLVSNSTEAEANPDTVRIVIMEEDVDAITENTDLKAYASRDNGANWVQATLVDEGDYGSGKRILVGTADVSGQASDKTMKWKIETLNNKDLKIHGIGLLWD